MFLLYRAQGNCDLFVLTKEDLDEVLTHYPSIKEQINKVAEERINAVRKRSKAKVVNVGVSACMCFVTVSCCAGKL